MSSEKKQPPTLKVLLVGDVGVGKTSLATRYALDSFQSSARPSSSVSGFDNYVVVSNIDGIQFAVELMDISYSSPLPSPHTSSQLHPLPTQGGAQLDAPPSSNDQLHNRRLAYQGCDVILLIFSIDKPESLKSIKDKYEAEIKTYSSKSVIKILVGTKQDLLEDQPALHQLVSDGVVPIPHTDAEKIALETGASYCPCSSKTREGVTEVFELAMRAAVKKRLHEPKNHNKADRTCPCLSFDWLTDYILKWDQPATNSRV